MNALLIRTETLEFEHRGGDLQRSSCATKAPLSLGNLNGEDSEHMSLFVPNEEGEIIPPYGKYKNYYLKHIGTSRSPTMPIHKK